jgi:hypothetical protein
VLPVGMSGSLCAPGRRLLCWFVSPAVSPVLSNGRRRRGLCRGCQRLGAEVSLRCEDRLDLWLHEKSFRRPGL